MFLWISDGGISPFFKSLQFPWSSPTTSTQGKKRRKMGDFKPQHLIGCCCCLHICLGRWSIQVLCCPLFRRLSLMGEKKRPSDVWFSVDRLVFPASPGGDGPWQVHTLGYKFTKERSTPSFFWYDHRWGNRSEWKWILCRALMLIIQVRN